MEENESFKENRVGIDEGCDEDKQEKIFTEQFFSCGGNCNWDAVFQ